MSDDNVVSQALTPVELSFQEKILINGLRISLTGIGLGLVGLGWTLYARSTAKSTDLSNVIKATESAFQTSSVITGVCAAIYLGLLLYRLMTATTLSSQGEPDRTPKIIALSFLLGFVLCMVGIFFALKLQINATDAKVKEWVDMFKSGFTMLTTSLTTIIGFYFAAKQGDKAMAQVNKANEDVQKAHAGEVQALIRAGNTRSSDTVL